MHMISKKDLSDAEMDTLTKSCSPTIVITANGEVQTHKEATVYVKELEGTLCILGSHTFVPITWMCKKQTSVSHSSTEPEIISLDGIPALD